MQIPACERPAEPAVAPEVPSAPRCIVLAKAGDAAQSPFEHAELAGDAFFGCRREAPPAGAADPVVACYRFDLGSGKLEAAAVPNEILHTAAYRPFPQEVAFEETSGAVTVKASGLKLDLDGQRAVSAELDPKAERLAVVADADSKPAVAYVFDVPGGVRRAKFVAGTVQDVVTGKVLRRIDLLAHVPVDPATKLATTDPQWGWMFSTTGGKLAVLNEGAGAQGVFIIVDPVAGVVDRVVKMPACI